jgi:hypothetical protein
LFQILLLNDTLLDPWNACTYVHIPYIMMHFPCSLTLLITTEIFSYFSISQSEAWVQCLHLMIQYEYSWLNGTKYKLHYSSDSDWINSAYLQCTSHKLLQYHKACITLSPKSNLKIIICYSHQLLPTDAWTKSLGSPCQTSSKWSGKWASISPSTSLFPCQLSTQQCNTLSSIM